MKEPYIDLWNNIQMFQIDEPNAAFPFSKKLAKEHNWTNDFTARAIVEYKKFILLCCISPTGASPSEIVDKVWHMHLTYTYNYWELFCKKTLGKEIHHHPSKGGQAEQSKHANWFFETLQLYEKIFLKKPPADIWLAPENNNASFQFHLPQFSWLYAVAIPFLVATFISTIFFLQPIPYLLNGPDFLLFFPIYAICILLICWKMAQRRKKIIHEIIAALYAKDDDHLYQEIYYVFGQRRMMEAGIIDLLEHGALELDENNHFLNKWTQENGTNKQNPLLKILQLGELNQAYTYQALLNMTVPLSGLQNEAFEQLKALKNKHHFQMWLIWILMHGIGILRIFQGIHFHRPVGYLVIELLCVATATIFLASFHNTSYIIETAMKRTFLNQHNNPSEGDAYRIIKAYNTTGLTALNDYSSVEMLYPIMFAYHQQINRTTGGDGGLTGDGGCGSSGCGSSCGGGCGGCGS